MAIFISFVTKTFIREVANEVKLVDQNHRVEHKVLEEQIVKRLSYLSLYTLHDRMTNVELLIEAFTEKMPNFHFG